MCQGAVAVLHSGNGGGVQDPRARGMATGASAAEPAKPRRRRRAKTSGRIDTVSSGVNGSSSPVVGLQNPVLDCDNSVSSGNSVRGGSCSELVHGPEEVEGAVLAAVNVATVSALTQEEYLLNEDHVSENTSCDCGSMGAFHTRSCTEYNEIQEDFT